MAKNTCVLAEEPSSFTGCDNKLMFKFFGNRNAQFVHFFKGGFRLQQDSFIEGKYTPHHCDFNFEGNIVTPSDDNNSDSLNISRFWEHQTRENKNQLADFGVVEIIHTSEGSDHDQSWIIDSKRGSIDNCLILKRVDNDKVTISIGNSTSMSTMTIDNSYTYVDGDSGTHVYVLDKKHVLIRNEGDCPSVLLLVKQNSLRRDTNSDEELDPFSVHITEAAQSLVYSHGQLKHAIVRLFQSIIDENRFAAYQNKDLSVFSIKTKQNNKNIPQKVLINIQVTLNELHITIDESLQLNAEQRIPLILKTNEIENNNLSRIRDLYRLAVKILDESD